MSNKACESIMEGEKLRIKALIPELRVGRWAWELEPSDGLMVEIWDWEMQRIEWFCLRERLWDFEIVSLGMSMGLWERGETESREPKGRQRANIEKQNGIERLGFFHLKLKLKWWVSHFFFFFFNLNFGRYWRRYNLNQPISAILANTTRFSPNQRKSAQVGTN